MKTKFCILLAALSVVGGCRNKAAVTDKPVVTVSIEPQRWALERLAGDNVEVRCLLARGGNPESYEPAFSHLATLEHSSAYITMGNLGFEEAIIGKVKANIPGLTIYCASDSIELLHASHGHHDHGADPHVWSSAPNMRIMASNMLRALLDIDPANAATYHERFTALAQHIDSIDRLCDSILTPIKGSAFLVWHPSLSYFARDYGLHQISLGSEGKEHSVADTRRLLQYADSARIFLIQKDFDPSQAQALINDIETHTIDPLNYDWDTELVTTARAIAH